MNKFAWKLHGYIVYFYNKFYLSFPDWIVALGPATHGADGLYEWAIVSDRLKLFNFVLVRDVQDFHEKYKDEVDKILESKGLNCLWHFRKTSHVNCQYAPKPTPAP